MVPLLALTNVVFTDVQFTTHLSDALDKPVFKKGAAFVFKYQAVTPESESKVRVFSPFPKIPDINLTDAYTILQTRGHTDSMNGMDTVKLCRTERMGTLYDQLFDQLEEKLSLIQREIDAAQTDQNQLVEVASSFLPPSIKPDHGTARSKRAVGIIAAAAGAAGLVLGSPVKDAACSALSIFSLCTDNKDLEENVDHVMATQKQFQAVLERVQTKNDENFFILGNEIKETQESVQKITEIVGGQLKLLQTELLHIKGVIASISVCNVHFTQNIIFMQQIRDYVDHLGTLYTHIKSYRAAFYAYKIVLFSTISSLAAGYVTPQFLLPSQLATIVSELASDEIFRGTKLSPAIRAGQEAIYYEIQMVLEVSLLSRGISVVLGIPMNSKKPFNVFQATPLYQPNDDGDTASIYHFSNSLLAVSTENKRFAELDASSLQQCSGNNRIKLCRQGFSTTTDETLLCLPSLFYNYDIPSLRNCKVESVLLPDAPQAFYLADGMYHIISRDPNIQMKNDSGAAGFSISSLSCRACLVRPSCSSKLSFNQGDLELVPDMDFCKNNPEPLLATIELTPSLDQIFKQVPNATHKFHTYSIAEARQSVLSTVRLELAELPNVKRMSPETLADLTRPIAKYYSSISPATSAALSSYLPTRTAVLFSLISVTLSLLTFCISFTLFRRQWTRLFAHPQRFFRGTSGRFLHIVKDSQSTASDTSFLYLSVTEFTALQALAKEALHRPSLNAPLTPTETINITNNPTNNTPIVSASITNVPQRAYPLISAPIYSAPSN